MWDDSKKWRKGCGRIVLFKKVPNCEMTRKYLSGSLRKCCSNSLNAKERCFSASFLISFSIGYTGPSFMKGKEIIPSHNSSRQQHSAVLDDKPSWLKKHAYHHLSYRCILHLKPELANMFMFWTFNTVLKRNLCSVCISYFFILSLVVLPAFRNIIN